MFRRAFTRTGNLPSHRVTMILGPDADQHKVIDGLMRASLPNDGIELKPDRVVVWHTTWPVEERDKRAMEFFVQALIRRGGQFEITAH